MTTKPFILSSLAALLVAPGLMAAELDISVTNLTPGMHFTPILITAHGADSELFSVNEQASMALQTMAEGGNIALLLEQAQTFNQNALANPAQGLLAPATSTSGSLTTDAENTHLSLAAMLLPTNDGFVGLDSWEIPTEAGTYEIYLNAYDAGTEANDELLVDGSGVTGVPGIPAAPGSDAGTGGSGVTNDNGINKVHIHPGNLGDTDLEGGISDVDSTVHRWLNPVAKLTVTVK